MMRSSDPFRVDVLYTIAELRVCALYSGLLKVWKPFSSV